MQKFYSLSWWHCTHASKSFKLDYHVHKYLYLLGSENEVHISKVLECMR